MSPRSSSVRYGQGLKPPPLDRPRASGRPRERGHAPAELSVSKEWSDISIVRPGGTVGSLAGPLATTRASGSVRDCCRGLRGHHARRCRSPHRGRPAAIDDWHDPSRSHSPSPRDPSRLHRAQRSASISTRCRGVADYCGSFADESRQIIDALYYRHSPPLYAARAHGCRPARRARGAL